MLCCLRDLEGGRRSVGEDAPRLMRSRVCGACEKVDLVEVLLMVASSVVTVNEVVAETGHCLADCLPCCVKASGVWYKSGSCVRLRCRRAARSVSRTCQIEKVLGGRQQ